MIEIIIELKNGIRKFKKYMKALLKDSIYKKDSFLELILIIVCIITAIVVVWFCIWILYELSLVLQQSPW